MPSHDPRSSTLLPLRRLAREVPSVEVATPSAQVRSKSQPSKVRHKRIARPLINLTPDVDQPSGNTSQSHNIDSSLNRAAKAEEQRHPDQVEAELNGVERCALLGESYGGRVSAGGADCPGAVGSVAHEAVEEGPGGAKDPSWGASGTGEAC